MRRRIQPFLLGAIFLASFASFTQAAGSKTPRASAGKATSVRTAPAGMNSPARSKSKSKRRVSRKSKRGQMSPAPDRITEIQEALVREGAYSGTPTGKLDPATVQAIQKFQRFHGLSPTGKLDALSLQKLGLGSEVAGAAAPLPIAEAGQQDSSPN